MEEWEVRVSVRGEQTVDGEMEANELTARGTLRRTAEGWRLSYEETGGEAGTVRTDVLTTADYVTLVRRGAVRSKMRFESGRCHKASYALGVGCLTMEVLTEQFSVELGENGGAIRLSYRLLVNGAEMSENRLCIQVQSGKTD